MNRNFTLPPRCKCYLRPFENLRSVEWQFLTEFSGQTIGTIFISQAAHEDCLTLAEKQENVKVTSKMKRGYVLVV